MSDVVRTGAEPLLSVIIPTHDVEPWIDDLVGSILASSLHDIEVLAVDDHSRDGTRVRLEELADVDPRVRVVVAHGTGGANARNVGLNAAAGKYVAFADGDDVIPPGAYERLIASLEESGSDMAFGDWLKFSSNRTWQPSRNWKAFDVDRIGVPFTSVPALIRGRAVWNKVIRRAFIDEVGLRFPEVPRSNDIVPMTHLYMRARQIDVLADCVYLYRDRPGTGSMTSRAGADVAATSYFTQETACARMVAAKGDASLSRVYSALVYDADSWLHLSRFLTSVAGAEAIGDDVVQSVQGLVAAAPQDALNRTTAHKRVLWALVASGHLGAAHSFNAVEEPARSGGAYDVTAFRVWVDALRVVVDNEEILPRVQRERLVVDGLVTLGLHHAHTLKDDQLRALLEHVRDSGVMAHVEPMNITNPKLRAMAVALADQDAASVRLLAGTRDLRLVVDEVHLSGRTAELAGPVPDGGGSFTLRLIARRLESEPIVVLEAKVSGDRWSSCVPISDLADPGRWELVAELATSATAVELPVVTARMPLPVATRADRIQVYSDRTRGWRVVLESRRPMTMRAAARLARRVRT